MKYNKSLQEQGLTLGDVENTYDNLRCNCINSDLEVLNGVRMALWLLADRLLDISRMPSFDESPNGPRLRERVNELKELVQEIPILWKEGDGK